MATWDYEPPSHTEASNPSLLSHAELSENDHIGANKDNLLFIVDCTEPMWHPRDEFSLPPVIEVLQTVQSCFRANAVGGSADTLSLMLFGTKLNNNNDQFANVYLIAPAKNEGLAPASADSILDITAIIKGGRSYFETKFGIAKADFKYADMFWQASRLLDYKKVKGTRRVIFLTNQDNLHGETTSGMHAEREKTRRDSAITRIRDLTGSGVHLALYGLDRPNHPFDYSLFFANTLSGTESGDIDEEAFSFSSFKDQVSMDASIRKRIFVKRSVASTVLKLHDGFEIPVKVYLCSCIGCMPDKFADPVSMKPVESKTRYIRTDTKEEFYPFGGSEGEDDHHEVQGATHQKSYGKKMIDFSFGFPYGGKQVVFSAEEMYGIKNLFELGIVLLGFRPISQLKVHHNIKHASFLYPDESEILGSTSAFSALLFSMAKLDKMAICRYKLRSNWGVRLVALLPQLEVLDENGIQERPPGFNVIFLPFADDLRPVPALAPFSDVHIERPLVETFKNVVDKFKIADFSINNFRNPVMQQHYSVIEGLALNLSATEKFQDTTQPPFQRFERFRDLFDQIKASTADAWKRGREELESEDPPQSVKKAKTASASAGDDALNEGNWKTIVAQGKLSKYNVAQLKAFLKNKDVHVSNLKKAELIEKIQELAEN